MKHDVSTIMDELFQADPSLRSHEGELEKLVELLERAKPQIDIDAEFVHGLKRKLMSRPQKETKEKKSFEFLNIFSMKKFGYAAVGAAFCALVLLPMYFFFLKPGVDVTEKIAVVEEGEEENLLDPVGGTLVYMEGDVEYLDGERWRAIEEGANIEEGDSVQIPGEGKAVITLEDGSVVRLNRETRVSFKSLRVGHIVVTHDTGDLYSRVTKSDNRLFDVEVENEVYRALGTAYRTFNTKEKRGVIVYESSVAVQKIDEDDIVVDQGKARYEAHSEDEDVVGVVIELTSDSDEGDEFLLWNAEEDRKIESFKESLGVLEMIVENLDKEDEESEDVEEDVEEEKEVVETPVVKEDSTPVTSGLTLSAKSVDGGVAFSWNVKNLNVDKGFKLVKSTSMNPVYPGNTYKYFTDSSKRSYTWALQDGQTYYFRVCQYLGGKCGTYSNNVKVTVPKKISTETPSSAVKSISIYGSGSSIGWRTDGYSKSGFKVVWSKNANPTYPTRSGDKYVYKSDPNATGATLTDFDGPGTYYVRVCEYLGGKCGVYSGQLKVELGDATRTDSAAVSSISLSSAGGGSVYWSVSGVSEKGFKIVWSKNESPTYPLRRGDKYTYLNDPNAQRTTVSAFDGEGTYYVRVCEYLGGACGVYSNQIRVSL